MRLERGQATRQRHEIECSEMRQKAILRWPSLRDLCTSKSKCARPEDGDDPRNVIIRLNQPYKPATVSHSPRACRPPQPTGLREATAPMQL